MPLRSGKIILNWMFSKYGSSVLVSDPVACACERDRSGGSCLASFVTDCYHFKTGSGVLS